MPVDDQIVQLGGAVLVLLGYILGQLGRLRTTSRSYLVINLLGSMLLAIAAISGRQWGFLLLNGTWALVSLFGLIRLARSTRGGQPAVPSA